MFIFAHEIRLWKENMKTNRIMDEIRSSISPEMKLQMDRWKCLFPLPIESMKSLKQKG